MAGTDANELEVTNLLACPLYLVLAYDGIAQVMVLGHTRLNNLNYINLIVKISWEVATCATKQREIRSGVLLSFSFLCFFYFLLFFLFRLTGKRTKKKREKDRFGAMLNRTPIIQAKLDAPLRTKL